MFSWLSGSGAGRPREGSSVGRSPSAPPEIRGRLNFSSLATPRPPSSRLSAGAASSSGGVTDGRLGDYHRSKQNPAVLDQFIDSSSPHGLYKNSPTVQPSSSRFSRLSTPHGPTTGFSPFTRRAQTPFRLSPFQSSRSGSPFGSGLVSMAVRGRRSHSSELSPVMVHLSSPLTSAAGEPSDEVSASEKTTVDPCNKEVIISALKKRKRWTGQGRDVDSASGSAESQPAAKRSRHATDQAESQSSSSIFARPSLHSRKRDHASSDRQPLTSSLSLKKPRVFRTPSPLPWKQPSAKATTSLLQTGSDSTGLSEDGKEERSEVARVQDQVTMPETGQSREGFVPRLVSGSSTGMGRTLKLSIPESEGESDSESVRGGARGGCEGVKGDGVEESSVDSGRGSRGSTPPVHEEEDEETREEERARKNRAELLRLQKSLTSVFPSLHKSSSRRKIPVFCATGSVPQQPATLSSTTGVSGEDWRMEREMARARLRSFLTAEDDPPTKPPSPTLSEKPAVLPSSVSSAVTTTTPAATSQTSSAATGLTSSGTSLTGSATSLTGLAGVMPLKPLVSKSVTFQLPNVATSTQSMSSVITSSSQTTSVQQSDSGSGTGPTTGSTVVHSASQTSSAASSSVNSFALSSSKTATTDTQQQQQQQQPEQRQTPAVQSFSFSQSSALQMGNLQTTPTATPTTSLTPTVMPSSLSQLPASKPHPQPPQLTLTAAQPSLSLPSQPQQQQQQQLLALQQQQQPQLSLQPQQQVQTQQQQQTHPQQQVLLPSLGQPVQQLQGQPSLPSLSSTVAHSTDKPLPGMGFGNLAPSLESTSGGFKFGSGGVAFGLPVAMTTMAQVGSGSGNQTQTTSSGQTSILQLQQASLATPLQQPAPSVSTTRGPTFNFGSGGTFNFSSGPQPVSAPQQQQKPTLVFGGGPPQAQGNLSFGGVSVGGVFGATQTVTTTAATSLATPVFNFSATTATTSSTQKPMFGAPLQQSLLPSNNPPNFSFGAAASQGQQSSSMTTKNLFNFTGPAQKPPQPMSSLAPGGGLQFGGGAGGMASSSGPPLFNFSATVSQTGSGGAGGSGMGLSFGASSAPSAGFNFSTGSASTGGLNFGATSGGGLFGGTTNQIQTGGMFGQTTPQNSSSSTGGAFNPSLTTPSKPAAQPPQLGPFNFTPQASSSGFNFAAAASGMGGSPGLNFCSPGVGGGSLFSAGTPGTGETSRPVATARRRRGRRK